MRSRSLLIALTLLVFLSRSALADSKQEKFWTDYVESCNPGSQLNGKAHFLGATNSIGPGSVWGTAGGTTNLLAAERSYLGAPDSTGRFEAITYATTPASCSGQGTRKWDFTLGIPVTVKPNSSASGDLSVALKNAKTITVAIDSVEIDSIPVAAWENSANKISHDDSAYTDAVDGKHYLMSAAVAVTGLAVKYILNDSISAGAKASFQAGQLVNIGTSDNPAQAQVDVSDDGKTITLQSKGRVFVLGQFLKIDKVKQKDQHASLSDDGFEDHVTRPQSTQPTVTRGRIKVDSKVPGNDPL